MKKLLKGIMGIASVAAVVAGAYYFTKKWMEEKDEELEDEFDDLDFDEDEDSREYVTLDIEKENQKEAETLKVNINEEDIAENEISMPEVEKIE